MENFLTPSNITFVLGVMGIIFTVFLYFKNPQVDSDKKDALLAQQVQFDNNQNERRFEEMNTRITESMTLAQNHIHTVDTKCDKLIESVNILAIQFGKLQTTIDERIPRKIT